MPLKHWTELRDEGYVLYVTVWSPNAVKGVDQLAEGERMQSRKRRFYLHLVKVDAAGEPIPGTRHEFKFLFGNIDETDPAQCFIARSQAKAYKAATGRELENTSCLCQPPAEFHAWLSSLIRDFVNTWAPKKLFNFTGEQNDKFDDEEFDEYDVEAWNAKRKEKARVAAGDAWDESAWTDGTYYDYMVAKNKFVAPFLARKEDGADVPGEHVIGMGARRYDQPAEAAGRDPQLTLVGAYSDVQGGEQAVDAAGNPEYFAFIEEKARFEVEMGTPLYGVMTVSSVRRVKGPWKLALFYDQLMSAHPSSSIAKACAAHVGSDRHDASEGGFAFSTRKGTVTRSAPVAAAAAGAGGGAASGAGLPPPPITYDAPADDDGFMVPVASRGVKRAREDSAADEAEAGVEGLPKKPFTGDEVEDYPLDDM